MENVFNALKAMEKASAREVAARLGVEPKEALEHLLALEGRGEAVSVNGYWRVNENPPPAPEPATKKRVSGSNKTQQRLIDIIQLSGEITAQELAERAGITPAAVFATLATAVGAHKIKRAKTNGKIRYYLPSLAPAETAAAPAQIDYRAIVEKIAEIFHGSVTDIPLLTVTAQSYKDRLAKVEAEREALAAENSFLMNGAARELSIAWMLHKTMLGTQAALLCIQQGDIKSARDWLEGTTDEAPAELPDEITVDGLEDWFNSQMISSGGKNGFLTRDEAEKAIRAEIPATDAFLREVRASEFDSLCGVAETMLVKFANQNASQITEAQGWEMIRQQASKRAAQLRQGGAA